ncbi:MAG: aminotransferase class IV [Anaerolineales bacterium]|nr:aminotransferase class IV [Anaerolineales bacterium]
MNIKAFEITPTKNIPLPTSAVTLDELTRALPQGFYTTFSTVSDGTRVMGLQKHLQRLYAPANETGLIPAADEATLRARIALLARENLPQESRARLILTKSEGRIYVGIQPFAPPPESVYADGAHVITSTAARHDPRIKDTGFITESAEQRKLLSKDVFEILLTKDGNILEGMTSNFYAVAGATLITARRGILLGVTRRAVLRIARGQGMGIKYRAPKINENFDEAFLTSSSRGIVPIVFIDNQPVGRGSVGKWTKKLMGAYRSYVTEKSERF